MDTLLGLLLVLILLLIRPAWLVSGLAGLASLRRRKRTTYDKEALAISFAAISLSMFSYRWFLYLPAGAILLAIAISLILSGADAENSLALYVMTTPVCLLAALIYGLMMAETGPWMAKIMDSVFFFASAAILGAAGFFILGYLTKLLGFNSGRW